MNNKSLYEEVKIEVVLLGKGDIITSSSAFDGEDVSLIEWFW